MTAPRHAPVDPGAADMVRRQQDALADELVTRQFAARPELAQRYGPTGRAKCLQDAHYHLSYLADAMTVGEEALFASYIAWAKVMLGRRGIPADDLSRHLDLMRTVLGERLEAGIATVAVGYINAALAGLPSMPADVPSYLAPDRPHADLAQAYLHALLEGERHVASQAILDAVQAGVPVKAVYLHVFQPAQREIGRLWQMNLISVAQEHYSTAATQLIMSQLYPQVFASAKGAGTLVATCVAGDLHEVGVRMVADFFELDGFHTYYLGANAPAQAVVDTVVARGAKLLGISATMLSGLRGVEELIRRVRDHPACREVKILVGGYPFLTAPGLWRTVGADGWATDAQQAIATARQFLAGDNPS